MNPRWWLVLLRKRNLSPSATRYLQFSNPRLQELSSRYAEAQLFDNSFWKAKKIDLMNFRGEWNYLAQLDYAGTERKYLMTSAYVAALDDQKFLERLSEDSLFGAITIKLLDDLIISRDLLDSVLEIRFLSRQLKLDIEDTNVCLDIGAGYGRFAHRFTALYPKSQVYCVDGVAVSTFLCEYYTRFRMCDDRAKTIPLYEMSRLSNIKVDFATNIHSWSECPLSAVSYWLELLADLQVTFLFVVPNWLDEKQMFLTVEPDGNRVSYLPEIERHGYRLKVMERKYGNSRMMAKYGIFNAPYVLFEKTG
jgi:putative sugar O-methyltransferase